MKRWEAQLWKHCDLRERNWIHLGEIVDRHYDTIWNEWKRLASTSSKRKRVLRIAAELDYEPIGTLEDSPIGTLMKNRRPDINGFQPDPKLSDHRHWERLCAHTWPYLTEEDLSWGDMIPIFIYHRAKTHWADYLWPDYHATRSARYPSTRSSIPKFTPYVDKGIQKPLPDTHNWYMVEFMRPAISDVQSAASHQSRSSPSFYCKKTQIELPRREDLDKFLFTDAKWIAMFQAHIYRFLVSVCIVLVKGRPNPTILKDRSLIDGYRTTFYSELMANETAFPRRNDTVPPEERPDIHLYTADNNDVCEDGTPLRFDRRLQKIYSSSSEIQWEHLGDLIECKKDDAERHLGLLLENPEYFQDTIRQAKRDRDPFRFTCLGPTEGEVGAGGNPGEIPQRDLNFFQAAIQQARNESHASYSPTCEPVEEDLDNYSQLAEWRNAIKTCVSHAIKGYEWWTRLSEALMKLRRTYRHNKDRLENRDNLVEFWDAVSDLSLKLFSFHLLAKHYSSMLIIDLNSAIRSHPVFEGWLARYDPEQPLGLLPRLETVDDDSIKCIPGKKTRQFVNDRKRIYAKLVKLFAKEAREQFGLFALVDNLEREVYDGSTRHIDKLQHIPDNIQELLSQLAVSAECLDQVESFQPWGTLAVPVVRRDGGPFEMQRQQERTEEYKRSNRLQGLTASNLPWNVLLQDGLPTATKFYYPDEDPTDQATVEWRILAENNLDQFWVSFLEEFGPGDGTPGTLGKKTVELLKKSRRRTAPWQPPVPPVEEKRKQKQVGAYEDEPETPAPAQTQAQKQQAEEKEKDEDEDEDEDEEWESYDYEPWRHYNKNTGEASSSGGEPSARPRTPPSRKRGRDENDSPDGESPSKLKKVGRDQSSGANTVAGKVEKIPLSARSMKTLPYLFAVPGMSRSDVGAEMPWNDFLKLMQEIGFFWNCEGGSNYTFYPGPDLARRPEMRGRNFNLHGPHPETTLNLNRARDYGTWIATKFKWTYDGFIERPRR